MHRVDRALEEIKREIPGLFAEVDEIRLFGSYAKGTNVLKSDVDLLLLSRERITDRVQRSKIRDQIDKILSVYSLESDVVFYTFADYAEDNSRFTLELRKDSKLIYRR